LPRRRAARPERDGEPSLLRGARRPEGPRTRLLRRAGPCRRRAAGLEAAARYRLSVSIELSPVLAGMEQYPFARLDAWRAEVRARGLEVIDFGMGDPREVTPAFIREALLASVDAVSSYPRATGLPELRSAIAGWIDRRFDVSVDAGTEIVPTLGS